MNGLTRMGLSRALRSGLRPHTRFRRTAADTIGRFAGTPRALVVGSLLVTLAVGCATRETVSEAGPNYSRPLPPGDTALRLVADPARWPDVAGAYQYRTPLLLDAMDESLHWFQAPSSRRHFPFENITHEQAQASVLAMRGLIEDSRSATDFVEAVHREFDVYESVGCDNRGTVLFTGYYAPEFKASRRPKPGYAAPLYRRPADLVTDAATGQPQGRRAADGRVVPYHTRREIVASRMFDGNELVWLENDLAAYIVHVNGSARLRFEDGSVMYVGYAGKTDRPYASLGQAMIKAGVLDKDNVTLTTIKQAYRKQPERVRELMFTNENFVFFTEYAGETWPSGSLGVPVTAEASLATDKKVYPRGGVVLVDTQAVTFSQGKRKFLRFLLDQDTGGAIQAPGRADIFMGKGNQAEILAGGQYSEGRLYYFFLKPQYVSRYVGPALVSGAP